MGEMIGIATEQPLSAYLARPQGGAKGAVIVIHEVWGLVDHTKSVANRFAAEGYVALAPDLLAGTDVDVRPIIGLQEALFDPERRAAVQPEMRRATAPMHNPEFSVRTTARLKACFEYAHGLPESHQSVAVVGFCFGGTYSFNLAIAELRLKAAVPFYGHCDHGVRELKQIACPMLAFYGEKDAALVSALPELTENMQSAGVTFTSQVYPNCGHAFFNDTNRMTYNAVAAADAWGRTLEFLGQNLH